MPKQPLRIEKDIAYPKLKGFKIGHLNIARLPQRRYGQAISEMSRDLSTNEIALFSIVLCAEFGQKNLHLMENKSKKY
jgi:hypothetical protein